GTGVVPPAGPGPWANVKSGVGVVYGALNIAGAGVTVINDLANGRYLNAGITTGTTGGFALAAKYAPKAIAERLGFYGTAAAAVIDVAQRPDYYAQEAYGFS